MFYILQVILTSTVCIDNSKNVINNHNYKTSSFCKICVKLKRVIPPLWTPMLMIESYISELHLSISILQHS